MNKLLDFFRISFALIAGFAVSVAALYLFVILLGFVFIELIFRTIENPTFWMFAADALCFALLIFVITRKAVRSSFVGIWKQILRNM